MSFNGYGYRKQENLETQKQQLLRIPDRLQDKYRIGSLFQRENLLAGFVNSVPEILDPFADLDQKTLTAEEANDKYGIENRLSFNDSVNERQAKKKHDRAQYILDAEILTGQAEANNDLSDHARNFFTTLLTIGASPENFLPWTKLMRLRGLGRLAKLPKGLTSSRVAEGVVDASISTAFEEPVIHYRSREFGFDYELKDSLENFAAAGVLGGLAGGFSGAVIKKSGQINHSLLAARLEQDALKTQVSRERFHSIAAIVQEVSNSTVPHEVEKMFGAMVKFDHLANINKISDDIYLTDSNLRSDLTRMKSKTVDHLLDTANRAKLLPEERFQDFTRATNLFADASRQRELPIRTLNFFRGLSGPDNSVTVKSFKKLFSRDIPNSVIAEQIGRKVNGNTKLQAPEAYKLMKTIEQRINKDAIKKQVPKGNLLETVKNFQERLLEKTKKIENMDLKKFKSAFNSIKRKVDLNPQVRGVNLGQFASLSPEEQDMILEFLAFIQKGNPAHDLLPDVLKGKSEAVEQLFENSKFNHRYKDSITPEQATNTVGDFLKETSSRAQAKIAAKEIENVAQSRVVESQRVLDDLDTEIANIEKEFEVTGNADDFEKISKQIDEDVAKTADEDAAVAETLNCIKGGLNGLR